MINNVSLMGRLTATPERKTTTSGKAVTSFTIAVERRFAPQGEERQTDFINCVAWGKTAEFVCKWFAKGDMIAVIGEIQTRNYNDKNGNNRIAVEVVVGQVSFCGSKNTNNTNLNVEVENTDEGDFVDITNGDYPF